MTRTWVAVVLAAGIPALAWAQDDYRHGRVRYAEEGVSIQAAGEQGAEEATANMPFLPGDRVWTDDRGRVEFQFGAAFLRLDEGTKVDYLDDAGRTAVRLWSGGLYAHTDGSTGFEIETPAGVVATRGRGIYRVDARAGGVRLSVYEGEATLDGDRQVHVREGERVVARNGDAPRVEEFDRAAADEFAMWADDRQEKVRYAREVPPELPAPAAPYYDELYDYGSWTTEPEVGNVWYPTVPLGWSPYTFGRWMWAPYGWTWIAAEPWGWAPSHYGRWGFSNRGWYWVPRNGWSPAWVRWAVGGAIVGWTPLGYHDRPIYDPYAFVKTPLGRSGTAVARGSDRGLWRYARGNELTKWNRTGNGWQWTADAAQMRVIESPRAQLTKDLQVVEGGAVPVATPRTSAVPRSRAVPRAAQAAPPPAEASSAVGERSAAPAPMVRRRGSFGEAGRAAAGTEAPAPAPAAPPPTETLGTGTRERARYREQPAAAVKAPRETAAPAAPAAEPASRARSAAPPAAEAKPAAAPPREKSASDEAAPRARKNADPAATEGGTRSRNRQ